MQSPIIQDLISDIESFCADRSMSDTTFGAEALNDPNFISDLRNGRECRFRTVSKVREFMSQPSIEGAA